MRLPNIESSRDRSADQKARPTRNRLRSSFALARTIAIAMIMLLNSGCRDLTNNDYDSSASVTIDHDERRENQVPEDQEAADSVEQRAGEGSAPESTNGETNAVDDTPDRSTNELETDTPERDQIDLATNDDAMDVGNEPLIESPLAGVKPKPEEQILAEEQALRDEFPEVHTIDIPENWTRALESSEVWVDVGKHHVIAGGVTCMDQGPLEMFICPLYTKEHESVIAVNAKSHEIHALLLGIGVNPGAPVEWEPEYKVATGPTVAIDVMWKDEESGEIITRNGRELVQNARTGRELDTDWIFGGSQTYTDPEDGTTFYYGDAGEMVCLSNFSTATMDIPFPSPQSNYDLVFAANTEKIPAPGTKVYVIFKPDTDWAPEVDEKESDEKERETEGDAVSDNGIAARDSASGPAPDDMVANGTTEAEPEVAPADRPDLTVEADGFPGGNETPEGSATDLARAFISRDMQLFQSIRLEPFGGEGNRTAYNDFLDNVTTAMQEEAEKPIPSAGGPKLIDSVFAARHPSIDGPASTGYALYNFHDVMFVDVQVELHNGEKVLNRTLVVQLDDKTWRVHPAPHTAELLSEGLNDETESTRPFSEAYHIETDSIEGGDANDESDPEASPGPERTTDNTADGSE